MVGEGWAEVVCLQMTMCSRNQIMQNAPWAMVGFLIFGFWFLARLSCVGSGNYLYVL